MAETMVDTSVVVDYLRGRVEARDLLESLRAADELATHTVVVAEVLTGARNVGEQNEIAALFRTFRIHGINETDALRSLDLLMGFRLSHGVGWHDCLIAATCERTRLTVATLNDRHFALFEGVAVRRPY